MTKYLVCFFIMIQMVCLGQPGNPDNPDVPIGGIEWLLGGGAVMGLRYMLGRNKSGKKKIL